MTNHQIAIMLLIVWVVFGLIGAYLSYTAYGKNLGCLDSKEDAFWPSLLLITPLGVFGFFMGVIDAYRTGNKIRETKILLEEQKKHRDAEAFEPKKSSNPNPYFGTIDLR